MKNKEVFQALALITQLGFSMLVPVLMCVWFGSFLQKKFSVDVILILLILGILAGCRNCYQLLAKALKEKDSKKI